LCLQGDGRIASTDGTGYAANGTSCSSKVTLILRWVEVDRCKEWDQVCNCSQDHFLLLLNEEWDRVSRKIL
ncbi:hypothetical protein Tco_0734201, partial [Tanacetum coccineum]